MKKYTIYMLISLCAFLGSVTALQMAGRMVGLFEVIILTMCFISGSYSYKALANYEEEVGPITELKIIGREE